MKRTLVLAVLALALVSCKKVTPEERITQLYETSKADQSLLANIDKIVRNYPQPDFGTEDNENVVDCYTLLLAREVGLDLESIVTQDVESPEDSLTARNLVAGIDGKLKDAAAVLVSAPVEDVSASVAAINLLKLYKDLKIKPNRAIKILLFQSKGQSGLNTFKSLADDKREEFYLNMELSSCDSCGFSTFKVHEPSYLFDQITGIAQTYLSPYGHYGFERGDEHRTGNPVRCPLYKYNIDKENMSSDIAATASLIYLLN